MFCFFFDEVLSVEGGGLRFNGGMTRLKGEAGLCEAECYVAGCTAVYCVCLLRMLASKCVGGCSICVN